MKPGTSETLQRLFRGTEMEKTPADIPGPPGSEGLAGVGLFFQQSPKQGIFVASVTPGCAGARTGCIKVGFGRAPARMRR